MNSLDFCKESLLRISESYMEASSQHDREWEEEKVRETWAQNVKNADSIADLMLLIT